MRDRAYDLLGSVWRSPLPLDARAATEGAPHDVSVTLSSEQTPELPDRREWIAGEISESTGYAMYRAYGRVWTRFPGLGSARFDDGLGALGIVAAPGTLDRWALLLAASLPAQRALLAGELCLHGSALSVGDEVVALVGPSGSGKSTLAALAVDHGVDCLSDDAVRVRFHRGRAEFAGGTSAIRLRTASAERLGKRGSQWRLTADGRVGRSLGVANPPGPLTTVALLRAGCSEIGVRELSPAQAVPALLACADRVLEVRAPELVRQRFAQWSDLARACRVLEVRLPVAETRAALDASFERLYRAIQR